MSKLIKIANNESSPFTSTNKNVSWTIPSGLNVNLSESYLEFKSHVNVTEVIGGDPSSGIYKVRIGFTAGQAVAPTYNTTTALFVQQSSIQTEKQGLVESLQNSGFLFNSLNQYRYTLPEKDSARVAGLANFYNSYSIIGSDYVSLVTQGAGPTKKSKYVTASHALPVNQILGVGDLANVNTSKTGEITIKSELNLQNIEASGFIDVTPADPNRAFATYTNATAVNVTDLSTVTTSLAYIGDANTILYIGMKITIQRTGGTYAGAVSHRCVITGMTQLPTGQYTITVDANLLTDQAGNALAPIAAGETLEMNMIATAAGAVTLSIDQVNLCISLNDADPNPKSAQDQFMSYTHQTVNGNNLPQLNQHFNLEGNCINVFGMATIPAMNGVLNIFPNLASYRYILNNESMTDRAVAHNSPLYRDMLIKTLNNAGIDADNITGSNLYLDRANGEPGTLAIIPCPVGPPTDQPKDLILQLSANNINQFVLFKQVLKMINY